MSISTSVKITEVFAPSEAYKARIHAAGCSDIAKDHRRLSGWFGPAEQYTGTYTGEEWMEINFGDVAEDEAEYGTEEWRQELRYQASEVHICNCAAKLGFSFK